MRAEQVVGLGRVALPYLGWLRRLSPADARLSVLTYRL
jgi:hypothetical protein